MKNIKTTLLLRSFLLGIITWVMISPKEAVAENYNSVSFQVFYDELTPYGDWVKDARYGYVWLPAVHEDFHPYGTNGHWVMTEYGNTWVSDYDWGWATFHYGRWYFDSNFQSWAWVPDYEWGPAWVDWRRGGGYYGWAPMTPGFSINFRVNIPSRYWVFVPQRRFAYRNVYNYYVPYAKRVKIYNNTTVINNTVIYNNNTYYAGPSRREVEKVTRTSYPVRTVTPTNSAGRMAVSSTNVKAYQPNLRSTTSATRSSAESARPARVLSTTDARTSRSNAGTPSAKPAPTNRNANATRSTRSATRTMDYEPYNNRTNSTVSPRNSTPPNTTRSTRATSNPRSMNQGAQTSTSTRPSTPMQNSRVSTPTTRTTTQRSTASPARSTTTSKPSVRTSPTQRNTSSVGTRAPQTNTRSSSTRVQSSTSSSSARTAPAKTSSRSTSSSRSSRGGNN